ncbi:eap1p [Saccharomyces arboricola H-6]|uniref:Eap1p n=1 Tax=Saccharomyces arboricola (strain H-6 / AS 2.3317 / CBS 10644) TaxID=1160507 RepID=J8PLM0_SACAR|nr:eap1p [Saccharomyces arboricola H-6]
MELNDPSIISATAFSGELPDGNATAATHKSQQAISNLFQKLAKKDRDEKPIGSVEPSTESSPISIATSSNNKESSSKKNKKAAMLNFSSLTDPITNYKPMELEYKTHAYSMNELYHLKPSSLTSASYEEDPSIAELVKSLPKRKFWRLRMGPPDQKHANNHHFNGNNGGGNWKAGYKNGKIDERRMSRTKNTQGGKRRSPQDDEDKKIDQEMLEMDKNLQLGSDVGHSIADFEDWKAKMKELESKKISKTKGANNPTAISPRGSTKQDSPADLRPTMRTGSSSITDFLNLKRQEKKEEPVQRAPSIPTGQPIMAKANVEQVNDSETNSDLGKSSSSRFSSFFNKSATSLPSLDADNQTPSPNAPAVNNDDNGTPQQSGSRLMSFFKESRSNTPNAEPQRLSAADQGTRKMQALPQFQQQPQQPQHMRSMAFPQNPPNNSAFFNGLLSKGKNETNTPPPPPGLIPHQGPQFPMMGLPPNFPQHMMPPPPGLVQFQKDSKDVNKKDNKQSRQNKNSNANRSNKGKQAAPATDLPQQQFMPPPPPPGFFPMHPNFPNGSMPPLPQGFPMPPNGMLPNGQQPQPPYPNMMLQGNFPPTFQQGFQNNSPMPMSSIVNANNKNVINQLPPGLNPEKNLK